MKISKKSQYGLRSLVYLAQRDKEFSSLRMVSEAENIPFDYLEKIFSKLEKGGLLKSKKGSQGGYTLSKSAAKIKVGQVLRILEGEINLVDCIGPKKCSRRSNCLTITAWDKIQKSLQKTIDSITLKSLID